MAGGAGWAAPPTDRKSPLITPAYRAELPRYTPLSYMRLRPYSVGGSSFQLSAERQGTSEPSDETDMSVDDVFAVSGHADDRRLRTEDLASDVDDTPSSPALATQLDTDDSVPSLENSFARSLPENMARSPLLRRASHRSGDLYARTMTPAGPSRRAPYNVPSRSPVSLGPLGHAYAMNMTPSSVGSRSARLAPWSAYARPAVMMGPSMSAPMTTYSSVYASYDDEETDDEVSAVDDDATDDETDGSGSRHPRGVPMRRALAHDSHRSMARSVPVRPYGAFSHSPDEVSRAQVHMAVAALDRLSMTSTRMDDEKKSFPSRAHIDENDEVAAIRDRLGGAAHCSAFISKLWHLMINPDIYGKYIHWNEAGDAIIINSDPDVAAEFAAEVLPKLFKHGNNASFVRQLNLYGFQRVSSSRLLDAAEMHAIATRGSTSVSSQASAQGGLAQPGAPTSYNTATELYGTHSSFAHPRFRRGQEAWLVSMKPRSSKKPKRPTGSDEAK